MEPCLITREVCFLRPGGYRLEDCRNCLDLERFLTLSEIPNLPYVRDDYLLELLEDLQRKHAPDRSFLDRCYTVVIENLMEVL